MKEAQVGRGQALRPRDEKEIREKLEVSWAECRPPRSRGGKLGESGQEVVQALEGW